MRGNRSAEAVLGRLWVCRQCLWIPSKWRYVGEEYRLNGLTDYKEPTHRHGSLDNKGFCCIEFWCVLTGSNRRHSACKADALPTELRTRKGAHYNQRSARRGHFWKFFRDFSEPADAGSGRRLAAGFAEGQFHGPPSRISNSMTISFSRGATCPRAIQPLPASVTILCLTSSGLPWSDMM